MKVLHILPLNMILLDDPCDDWSGMPVKIPPQPTPKN